MSNPKIAEEGKETRFKPGNRAAENNAQRKNPLQYALQYLSRQIIDPNDLSTLDEALPSNPTAIDLVAVNIFKKAIMGDIRSVSFLAKTLNAPSNKAVPDELKELQEIHDKLKSMSDDELEEQARNLEKMIEELLLKNELAE